jgi:hypothetical protein
LHPVATVRHGERIESLLAIRPHHNGDTPAHEPK